MSEGLSNYGEEQFIRAIEGTQVDVILYDDSTDTLTDADGTGAITTEPVNGTTTKTITVQAGDLSLTNGDWTFSRNLSFTDLTDATGRVDAIAVSPTASTEILWRGLTRKNGTITPISDLSPVDEIDPLTVEISLD